MLFLNEIEYEPIGSSLHTLLHLGKAQRPFIPPFCNHCKIVEIFLELMVLREREDYRDLVPILVYNILLDRTHGISLHKGCIHTTI